MTAFRIALANIPFPESREESVTRVTDAIGQAAAEGARAVCFPECYIPGYRGFGRTAPAPDPVFLERSWAEVAAVAAKAKITAIVGTERVVGREVRIAVIVITPDGEIAGFQDKVQLDPSEDGVYSPGTERHLFQAGRTEFRNRHLSRGVAISRDRALGGPARGSRCVPSASGRAFAGRFPPHCVRGPGEHVS
jgi:predicted amidohydrolase